ncbi:hypothetical protein QBC40DRAFT_316291 [Triangularia verruculosa]|uniref:Uncharacterized protein n=1 Tax=Triangularia verruculosa TaxID=2587418 RepID=A0AAN7AYF6_9PEZI|nr:hypothetical protein QBC40DRAFT_316291 [Triangularia verruculosa]
MANKLDLESLQHSRARWRRTLLFPSWLLQILILLCLMGIFAYRLAETFEHYSAEKKNGAVPLVEVVWEATNVGFNLLSLLLTILELARYLTERLTPFLLVSTNLIKLTLSFAVLGLDIVAHLQKMDGYYSTIGLSLDCGLLAASLSSFVYAIRKYRKSLKYEQYHLTDEVKRVDGGGGGGGGDGGRITGLKPYNRDSASYRYDYARTVESEDRRVSGGRWDGGYKSQTGHLSPKQHGSVASSRTAVTVTEISPTGLKHEIDRTLGEEFGWVGRDRKGSDVSPSGSLVHSSGVVHMSVPEIHVSRQQSWRTEVIAEESEREGDGDLGARVMGGEGRADGDRDGLLRSTEL